MQLHTSEKGTTWDIAVIGGRDSEKRLLEEINQWVYDHPHVTILDIKYGYAVRGGAGYYSAMLVYQYEL